MGKPPAYDPVSETEYLVHANLADAEADEALSFLASTYDPERDRVVPGIGSRGPRILNFAPMLVREEFPLNDLVKALLHASEKTVNAKVEIEFAITLQGRRGERPRARLGFLQVRSMVVSDQVVDVTVEDLSDPRAIVASDMVMGNGTADDIQDIVFVRPDKFSPLHTPAIAQAIGVGKPGTAATAAALPADWIRPLGQFPSIARHSRRLEPDLRGAGDRRGDAARDECGVEPGLALFSQLVELSGKLLHGATRAPLWNQLGLAEPAARCARDGIHPPCAADREALGTRRWADRARSHPVADPRQYEPGKKVKPDETQFGTMLHALQERAKELNCLYQVGELLSQSTRPLEEIFRGIIEVLPPGWQYPHDCQARILFENLMIQPPDFQATPWVQKANIVAQGETVGTVEVSYRREMPRSDEGPFLKEERKLIETIAERIASAVTQRRLRAAFEGWAAADAAATAQGEWRIVLEFLRDTDPALLKRISRKLINHLSWSGVQEAKELLRRGGAILPAEPGLSTDENRPLPQDAPGHSSDLTTQALRIAGEHLSETEILNCVTRWIKEDKASFLVRALENQDTSLGEIMECVERYRHIGVEEGELSLYTQKGLRVSLIRRFFSENLDFINVAKNFIDVKDFYDLLGKVIFPPGCHGKLGGKSAGLFLAKKIIDKAPEASALLHEVKVPRTWYLTSDWIQNFVHHNDLEDVLNRKYMEIDQVRQEYPHLVALFKSSSFPSEFAKGLALALDDLGDVPLIVRSSSLLEDRPGSAFSGKYKSLFLGNRGTKEERLAALMDAIAEVYASIFGPDPTEYRAERGLLDVHEEMGIMIQEVVGQAVGKYFLPRALGLHSATMSSAGPPASSARMASYGSYLGWEHVPWIASPMTIPC